ncbi:MAG TPA: diacylglycerol kinase family protein [Terriglobales bacterium]|nr:diacylglycerol kinase family protein [Terriglobales bacterium]
MRRAALLYNPASGVRRERRAADVEAVRRVLESAGIEASAVPTRHAGSAAEQAAEAIAAGCDAILACGGDGTVHEALQGIVATGSRTPLGVIPLGTGNALANDLGLSRDPAQAAQALVQGATQRIALGRMEYTAANGSTGSRWFVLMAGCGPDACMLYSMNLAAKAHIGMGAYYWQAGWMFLTRRFPPFEAEVTEPGGAQHTLTVCQMMAVRISYFGGALRRLAPGAALNRDCLRVLLYRPPVKPRYFLYLLGVFLGINWRVPGVEAMDATEVVCRASKNEARTVHAEADGELLGRLPVRVSIVPDALTLLVPRRPS